MHLFEHVKLVSHSNECHKSIPIQAIIAARVMVAGVGSKLHYYYVVLLVEQAIKVFILPGTLIFKTLTFLLS